MLIFADGLTQNNPSMLDAMKQELAELLPAPELRRLEICFSPLGYEAGVIGAVAVPKERFSQTNGAQQLFNDAGR